MRVISNVVFRAVCVLTLICTTFATAAQDDSEIFDVELSPDGSAYGVLRMYDGQRIVAIYEVDAPAKQPMAVGLGAIEANTIDWGSDENILVQAFGERGGIDTVSGVKKLKFSRWLSISRETGKSTVLFDNQFGRDYYYYILSAGKLLSTLPNEKERALFSRASVKSDIQRPSRLQDGQDTFVLSAISVNLKNSRQKRAERGRAETINWLTDQSGMIVGRIDSNNPEKNLIVYERLNGKGNFRKSAEIDLENGPYNKVEFIGASENKGVLQTLVTDKNGATKLIAYDIVAGAFGDIIFQSPSGIIDAIDHDPALATVNAVAYQDNGLRIHHIDASDNNLAEKLEQAIPGATILIQSHSRDDNRYLIKALYGDRATEYYLYDKSAKSLELIAQG